MRRIAKKIIRHTWSLRTSASLYLIGGLLAVFGAVSLLSHYAVSPAQGIIAVFHDLGPASAHAIDMTPSVARGDYASFQYPAGLSSMTGQAARGSVLAVYNWKHNDIQTWRLAISIVDVPTYKMTDNNAYLFRKMNPRRFRESLEMVNGHLVPVMTDTTANGFSKIGFLRSGRYQAIVSLCGDDQRGSDDLQATLAMVLHSWHWQQS